MQQLRFHRTVYSRGAIDAAVALYAGFGTIAVAEAPPYFEVTIEAANPEREPALAGEVANSALALTIEDKRP
jgi:hypothetical protein